MVNGSILLVVDNPKGIFDLQLGPLPISMCKPTHLTSVFSLQTSVFTSPHGTTLKAFAYVHTDVAGC